MECSTIWTIRANKSQPKDNVTSSKTYRTRRSVHLLVLPILHSRPPTPPWTKNSLAICVRLQGQRKNKPSQKTYRTSSTSQIPKFPSRQFILYLCHASPDMVLPSHRLETGNHTGSVSKGIPSSFTDLGPKLATIPGPSQGSPPRRRGWV